MENPEPKSTVVINVDSPPRVPIGNVPSGLISFCQKNARKAYVVPSSKNFIYCRATNLCFPMKHVKLDIGATRSLWYFPSTDSLLEFFRHAPSVEDVETGGHLFTLAKNQIPGGYAITLKCTHIEDYGIELGTDIVPNVIPSSVDCIQFHLCTEDMKYILNPENADIIRVPEVVKTSLQTHLTNLGDRTIPRRSWSLLGNDVLGPIAMIKLKNIVLLCQLHSFEVRSWQVLLTLEQKVIGMGYLDLPSEENEELHLIADGFISSDDIDYSEFEPGIV